MIDRFVIIGEPDGFSFKGITGKITCLFSEFFDFFSRMNRLRCINSQKTNTSFHSSYRRINRIPIYDFCDKCLLWSSIQNFSAQNIVRRNRETPSKRINLDSSTGESKCVARISERDACNSLTQSESFSRDKRSAELIRTTIITYFTGTERKSF